MGYDVKENKIDNMSFRNRYLKHSKDPASAHQFYDKFRDGVSSKFYGKESDEELEPLENIEAPSPNQRQSWGNWARR